jgi:hypothetical protein
MCPQDTLQATTWSCQKIYRSRKQETKTLHVLPDCVLVQRGHVHGFFTHCENVAHAVFLAAYDIRHE